MTAPENYTSPVIEQTADGVFLRVYAAPGASRDRVVGIHNGALKVSVTAAPEKGKANEAICETLAKRLGLKRAQFEVVSGTTARLKRVRVDRIRRADLEARLRDASLTPSEKTETPPSE